MLLSRTLGNWISKKENNKCTCGGTIIWVTSPVHIREAMQMQWSVCKKLDTKVSLAIKITKHAFDLSPMVFGWCVHKLGVFIHAEGNI